MPGYKIVLRILLVLMLLGGIGVLIFYLVGGFSNTKSAYNAYNSLTTSENYKYMQENFSKTSDAYAQIDSQDAFFEEWYSCYETQACVFFEFGEGLYFSQTKASKEFADKMSVYQKKLNSTAEALKTFLNQKAYFDEHAGIEDEGHVQEVLAGLAVPIKNCFYAQIESLSSLNVSLINFSLNDTNKSCGSLKQSMLEFMLFQSNLLLSDLKAGNAQNIAFSFEDNKGSIASFNAQKASNFVNQTVEGSNEFNLLLCYNLVESSMKQSFLNTSDKTTFVNGKSSAVQTNLGYVMKVMGWED